MTLSPLLQAQVRKRTKGFYYLLTPEGRAVEAKAKGNLFQKSKYDNQIAVGDRVLYQPQAAGQMGLIHEILPRQGVLSRARVGIEAEQVIAANVDQLVIVQAATQPEPKANFLFRLLVAANRGEVAPLLILTKTDLLAPVALENFLTPFKELKLPIYFTSNRQGGDEEALRPLLEGKTSVISGPSGVGKSSLLNRLYSGLNIKVGEVSQKTQKGGHTTTLAELHLVAPGTAVIDTPGVREFGFWGLNAQNLYEYFPGLEVYQGLCRHRNCRHLSEPDCRVKQALASEKIHPAIYRAYQDILTDLEG